MSASTAWSISTCNLRYCFIAIGDLFTEKISHAHKFCKQDIRLVYKTYFSFYN